MKTVRYYLEIEGMCTLNCLELSKKDFDKMSNNLEKRLNESNPAQDEFYVERVTMMREDYQQFTVDGFAYLDGTTTYRLYYKKCKEGYCFKNKR